MRIGSFDIAGRVLLVAEIGNNHEGNFDVARTLVEKAAEAGAGAVKFQTYRTECFVRRSDEERFRRMKRFELSPDRFAELSRLARARGLLFISTPLDLPSVTVLEPLVDAYKIASGDITFFPLIDAIRRTGKPMILSTGASTLDEVVRAVEFIGAAELAVLHCVSSYPAPPEQVNLAAIGLLAERLRRPIGYSDHVLGIDVAAAAVTAGARIVEKHFTLDKNTSEFRDHALSADPTDLAELVKRLGRVDGFLGRREKAVQPCEALMVTAIRRSIVAAQDRPRGYRMTSQDLTWLRPADGLPPGQEARLIGRALTRDVRAGEALKLSDVN
jgi:sialic acid synthase SpsE